MNDTKKCLSILTAIQIIFFGVVILAAVVVKALGGTVYPAAEQWYKERLNASVLANIVPESQVTSQWSSAQVQDPERRMPAASQLGDVSSV